LLLLREIDRAISCQLSKPGGRSRARRPGSGRAIRAAGGLWVRAPRPAPRLWMRRPAPAFQPTRPPSSGRRVPPLQPQGLRPACSARLVAVSGGRWHEGPERRDQCGDSPPPARNARSARATPRACRGSDLRGDGHPQAISCGTVAAGSREGDDPVPVMGWHQARASGVVSSQPIGRRRSRSVAAQPHQLQRRGGLRPGPNDQPGVNRSRAATFGGVEAAAGACRAAAAWGSSTGLGSQRYRGA